MPINTALTATVLAAGSAVAIAGTTPDPWRQFDAALDTPGDATWDNTSPLQGGSGNNFSFASAQTPAAVSNPLPPGITAAYEMGTTGAVAGSSWSFWGQAGGGRANHPETSFEVAFRVDNLSGQHLIMEIGGAGAGVSIGLDGGNLIWATNPGGAGTDDTLSISTGIGTGWHHAVGVWNRNTLSTALYVDGDFVGDLALPGATTGWVGGNEATLGGVNTSAATTMDLASITEYDGAIALFNYYREELTAQNIQDRYDSLIIPAPGSLALVATGLLAARRRR